MLNKMVSSRNKKGFTLMEMLIVVAIIAILVAVSVPVFTSQLDKAKESTDQANQRAAKAVAVATYLADTSNAGKATNGIYDAVNGKLILTNAGEPTVGYGKCSDHNNEVLQVTTTADGTVYMAWIAAPASATTAIPAALTANGTDLD